MDGTLIRGRWAATRTARLYISGAVAELVRVTLPKPVLALLRDAANLLRR